MIDVTVTVTCDHGAGEAHFCEAEFETSRTEIPADLRAHVDRQLQLRGWTGTSRGRVECPLHHRASGDPQDTSHG